MSLQKNVAGQKWLVFAFNKTTNEPVTGDAANIDAYLSKDYATAVAIGDVTPIEVNATNAKGYYRFDLTQAETNFDVIEIFPRSSTANVEVIGVPGREDTFISTVDTVVDSILTDTAEIGANGAGLTSLGGMSTGMKAEVNAEADTAISDAALATAASLATVDTEVGAIQTDLDNATDGLGALKTLIDGKPNAAQVNTEVDNAIVTYGLDHLIATAVSGVDVADNSILAKLVSKMPTADWDDFVNTTDALQAIRDKLTDVETDTAEIGVNGAGLTDLATQASITALNDPTVGEIADQIWDEDVVLDHNTVNTAGKVISDIITDTAEIGAAGAGLTSLPESPADVTKINGDTTSAANLAVSAKTMITGLVVNPGNAASSTQVDTDITVSYVDQYKGKLLIFTSGANHIREATKITGSAVNGVLTVEEISSTAPNGTAVIIL